jgi:hypothetical protein
MRRRLTDFVFKVVERSYAKLGVSLYYDFEVEAMIEGNVSKAIDEVISVAYDESYFFITQRLTDAGIDEVFMERVLNNEIDWVKS